MLDVKYICNNYEEVLKIMGQRGEDISSLEAIPDLYASKKKLILEVEELKRKRNETSDQIATLKRNKEDATNLIKEMAVTTNKIKELDVTLREISKNLEVELLSIPNIPDSSVPFGMEESDNKVLREWGSIPQFTFKPKSHWEIGEKLGILDFASAAKVTGSRFVMCRKEGARLERALLNFMLDTHVGEHGYEEVFPPSIVNKKSLMGTGQLPKFADDLFHLADTNYSLIPTQEVPITNMHANEVISPGLLPIKYAASGACFRSESGSAGKDTRGIIRLHQFNKVELVCFVEPEDSERALEGIVNNAEKILQLLGLPYRVMNMCTGDLGFTAAKKYDIEVWLPGSEVYREISSCSNFKDFQARRAQIRFRRNRDSKPEYVHTLNGSGLAIGRTMVAIIENYQQDDGSVLIPKVLRNYMGGLEKISLKE